MKAALLVDVGKIEIGTKPDPVLPPGGLVVKISACAICTTDIKIYRNGYVGFKPPLILGHEFSGTVAETGKGVTAFKRGDAVAVCPNVVCGKCYYCSNGMQTACDGLRTMGIHFDGGFAEYAAVPEIAVLGSCVNKITPGTPMEEAALIDPFACAINASELSSVKAGDTVAIIGAGPTGCMNAEICREAGARVIMIQLSPGRLEQSRFTGADFYLSPLKDDVPGRLKALTGGVGPDTVIVACASGEAQQEALDYVRKRGNVNFFGGLPKSSPFVNLNTNLIHYKECSVVGTHGCDARQCSEALGMISSGKVKAGKYISAVFSLPDFAQAVELAESRKALKVVVRPS